jgi:hypothetical protein
MRGTELLGTELGMFMRRTDNTHRIERRYSDMPEAERRREIEALIVLCDEVKRAEMARLAALPVLEGTAVEVDGAGVTGE